MSFRYEITAQAMFGSSANVIAVKANNSSQPASRWYAGAGIYRHVRLIATDPVHVAQWATFVTTPTATTSAATVHVATTVTNQGTAAQSVTVQAVVTRPERHRAGARARPPRQNVAAGASVNFTVDVPVSSPQLWSPTSPSMYQLTASVRVGSATVDDDVVPFGIRTIKFDPDTGFSLNGTSHEVQGRRACTTTISGLGAAVPMRAWQRRLAQLKVIGVNAIRTVPQPLRARVLRPLRPHGVHGDGRVLRRLDGHKVAGDFGGTTFNKLGAGRPDRHAEARSQPPERRALQHRQRDPRRAVARSSRRR